MPVETARQVVVRRLKDKDQPLLEQMYDALEPLGEALGLPPEKPDQRRSWLASLRDGINLCAFVDGTLVGHLALVPIGNAAELVEFVHQDFRRREIGTSLARAAVEEARAAGYGRISVFIDSHNKAARLGLLKFGFLPVWEDLPEAEYVYWLTPGGGRYERK
jgi:ribosomal protein S18 acetylase RimI-like enzyme